MKPECYTRPAKPRRIAVRTREAPASPALALPAPSMLAVHGSTECHVTPAPVAARMVELLGPVVDGQVLEPHGGTGNLVQALYGAGYSRDQLVVVERSRELALALAGRFVGEQRVTPIEGCFLEWAGQARAEGLRVPRIVMNPPFRQVRRHMAAAVDLLGSRVGQPVLVALVPVTFEHPEAEQIERLPLDTFAGVRVHTKIIRINRGHD